MRYTLHMEDLVERVARAIHASYAKNAVGYPGASQWDQLSDYEKSFGLKLANAALAAALPEPGFVYTYAADEGGYMITRTDRDA